MQAALGLARRGLGNVWPNPAVGCILVEGPVVVARGWTQPGGRPHAETEALRRAGAGARGATAYVTLEPCAHHGETPPCTEALVAAGIRRAVIALEDPDPRVAGAGIERLREAGIEVIVGPGEDEAAALNAGFISRVTNGRPLVTLKLATTLDGRIATHAGDSRWITGAAARDRAHALRAGHDAVLIGSGTALADDPLLTCRLPGLGHRSPVRVVVDGRLRVPLTSALVAGAAEAPTWLMTLGAGPADMLRAYRDCGVEVLEVGADADGNPDMQGVFKALAGRGLTRVLVEGGAHIAAAILRQGLVDRLVWFRAARMIGGDGVPAAVGYGIGTLAETSDFVRVSVLPVGDDLMETYARAA